MTTSIVSVDATTSKMQVGGVDAFQFKPNGVMESIASINGGSLYGNRVINGAQEIDQVNSGAAVTPASIGYGYATDMFAISVAQASKLTFQQVADAPTGLRSSLKITVAAQFSPAASDNFHLQTAIEGKDVIDFQFGTAGAATITLSNWIKGSVAGTYSVGLRNIAGNRSYVGTITVSTSWTQVKITLQGDVTGTWPNDNTAGLVLHWDLGSGSNFNTTAGAWQAGNFLRTSGSVTFVNQVAGSTLNITGVDCRLGSTAPAVFERRANELQLAQRYYWRTSQAANSTYSVGSVTSPTTVDVPILLPVTMRTSPTVAGVNLKAYDTSVAPTATISSSSNSPDRLSLILASSGLTAGRPCLVQSTGSSYIEAMARLF